MKDDRPPEWRALQDISYELSRLDYPLWIALSMHGTDDAIANSLRSRQVPVRGRRADPYFLSWHESAFERIEQYFTANTEIKLISSEIVLRETRAGILFEHDAAARQFRVSAVTYREVEADLRPVERWLRENALPSGYPQTANSGLSPDATGRQPLPQSRETELKDFLINHAREQARLGQPNNNDTAQRAAEAHFNAPIPRDRIRKLRREARCSGRRGRPRKSAEK
jgi:hypothetical protein